MEFSFNTFFGFEKDLMAHPEMLIFVAFLGPILLMLPIALVGWAFRKLKFNMYIINVLLYTLMFTFLFGILTIFVLYFITDKNGVKLMYCWLTIFAGMFFFCLMNEKTITKMFTDWSKIIEAKDKRKK
ncbi:MULTISPECIES: hypothetical protein [unclassified Chryseobacterium]|uniref:hypothetical protein n=1 Tax=unclassified Chryseobacterium TaxID=2593645 RepID=UPI00100BF44C|nr:MULTISPECIES: hypothetical protein [unclassified Chryseobacterium]RXM51505.1 hypothetical protein BOQ64_11195 [Chryseobacterium sp. CH25]RXM67076.1 hypothetical protein BOQ60_03900 [Chryseobacterium sp. CH1]